MGMEALLRGWVSRMLPQAENDNDPSVVRLGRFGDVWTIGGVRKQHALADEGSYFIANNAGAGIASAAAPTAFSDTAPMATIQNTDTAGNQNGKRIHLDYIRILQTAVGTAGTDLRLRGILDYTAPSGGTLLTTLSPNSDVPKAASVAVARLFPVGIAQTGNSRQVFGGTSWQALMTATAPLQALDEVTLNFGAVEWAQPTIVGQTVGVTIQRLTWNMPPVII